jgi:SAM-dependent methyltransferase
VTVSERLELCHVCGGRAFEHTPVLWPELVAAWQLSDSEAQYIDVQQGTHCRTCGSNVRSIALARALMRVRGFDGTLTTFVGDRAQQDLRFLEINEAGTLHPLLRLLPGHQLGSYPDVDMMNLPFAAGAFDMVVHSDTLEHVSDPLRGLDECRRVLDDAGALVFTVPVIVGRLSRSRAGLPASYHGHEDSRDPGMLVHTEFGADVWTFVTRAGFSRCELLPFQFPAGLAIVARP